MLKIMQKQKINKIFVYSGTGNSLAAAKQMAKEFDAEIIHITSELAQQKANFECEVCIVIFPTYGYGMPRTVKKFILNSSFNIEYLAVLTTIGSHHGGSLAEAIRCFRKRKQKMHFTKGISSVENFVHLFGWKKVHRADVILQKQSEITSQIIEDIKQRKQNRRFLFRPFSSFVASLMRWASRIFAKRYKFLPTCNNCGVCSKVCPANAIKMEDKPVLSPKKCEHCQGCLQLCPKKAIKFGRITPDSERYCHKDIKLNELLKR